MASHSISDVEQLLGIKAHVIRYWEKEIPLVQPAKDLYGRRIYSDRDMQILSRLKYLLYDRRFTIEGAKAQLYRELAGDSQDLRACLSALRSQLLELFFLARDSAAGRRGENAGGITGAAGDAAAEPPTGDLF